MPFFSERNYFIQITTVYIPEAQTFDLWTFLHGLAESQEIQENEERTHTQSEKQQQRIDKLYRYMCSCEEMENTVYVSDFKNSWSMIII